MTESIPMRLKDRLQEIFEKYRGQPDVWTAQSQFYHEMVMEVGKFAIASSNIKLTSRTPSSAVSFTLSFDPLFYEELEEAKKAFPE